MATNDRTQLAAAKARLDEELSRVPEEHREAMRSNLRVNREILEAWEAQGEGE